jgi:hypothetical protein
MLARNDWQLIANVTLSQMMASKFLYDEGEEDGVLNDEWAASVNMDVKELNELERNFLAALVSDIAFILLLHH